MLLLTGIPILIKRAKFNELGGFNELMVLGDDWEITRMIPRKKLGVADTLIWTTNRRFQSQGDLNIISKYFRRKDNRNYMHMDF